jgi:DNA polymerase-1
MLTQLLYDIYSERLKAEGLEDLFYKEETMPLYKEVTIDMKRKGFPIDIDHFTDLKTGLRKGIDQAEDDVMHVIGPMIAAFEEDLLSVKYPAKPKGSFPKALAEVLGAPLPKNGDKVTIAAKAVQKQIAIHPQYTDFYNWILGKQSLGLVATPSGVRKARELIHFAKPLNKGSRYVFNIGSNDHLRHLFINRMGYSPIKKSEKTGKATVDEDFINAMHSSEQDPDKKEVLDKIVDFKKLKKLLSTYVEGILDRSIGGMIYTDMLQFGTISGRYSSRNPNLQNQPRIKDEDSGLSPVILKYTNEIRKGFIAGAGYKVVNADYSSLEPVCFAHMSGDEKLRDVFRNGFDLYSTVAIDVFGLTDYSADKSAKNYLGKHKKEFRQKAKIFCLAVVYGAEEAQVAKSMGLSWAAAKQLIQSYLNAYPNLKKYMAKCNYAAKKKGMVQTEFGRIRHLKEARAMHVLYGDKVLDYKWANKMSQLPIRKKLKNALNNAKNFPIQGLAAHIVNRAMIATNRAFKKHKIDGWLALQVHDEITCIVREDHAELAAELLQEAMENTTIISVPLRAEPLIADNWAEAK